MNLQMKLWWLWVWYTRIQVRFGPHFVKRSYFMMNGLYFLHVAPVSKSLVNSAIICYLMCGTVLIVNYLIKKHQWNLQINFHFLKNNAYNVSHICASHLNQPVAVLMYVKFHISRRKWANLTTAARNPNRNLENFKPVQYSTKTHLSTKILNSLV